MTGEEMFAELLRNSVVQPADLLDPEDAAVFIADESGHPYDWQLILADRGVYRRRYRLAEQRIPQTPDIQLRLLDSKKSLDRKHRL